MTFVILLIIAVVLLYPYISTVARCRRMLTKLGRIAKSEAYNIIPLRRFPWLPRTFSGKYDFLLEGRGSTIAIKLVSCVRKNSFLMIRPDGNAAVGYAVNEPFEMRKNSGSTKKFGKFKNISSISENWNQNLDKNIDKAFLIYPFFKDVIFNDGRGEASLKTGDVIFGKAIHSPYSLEQKMKISGKALAGNTE